MRFVVNVYDTNDPDTVVSTDPPTSVSSDAVTLTIDPTVFPTVTATTDLPTLAPTFAPSEVLSDFPTGAKSLEPSFVPTTKSPTLSPSDSPSSNLSHLPSSKPTIRTANPTILTSPPTPSPTPPQTTDPTLFPTPRPTPSPTPGPTLFPTIVPIPDATPGPTLFPTARPSSPPTRSPSSTPTQEESSEPSRRPTLNPTFSTEAPVQNSLPPELPTKLDGESITQTLSGLQIGMAGITELSASSKASWEELTRSFSTSSVFNDLKDSVSNFVTTYEITNTSPITLQRHHRMTRGIQRELQTQQGIIVEYTQTFRYDTVDPTTFTPILLATLPFETDSQRTAYVTLLGTSSDDTLSEVTGVSEIQISEASSPSASPESSPTNAPSNYTSTESSFWTKAAIIGVACGGAALLILVVIFCICCFCRKGDAEDGDGKSNADPPLQVDVRADDVSALAGPQGGPPTYGDQSVATVDYDYSKAYGGAGDTSVSSAGGTFGSNTQNITLPSNAAATGALGAMDTDDNDSYDAQLADPRLSTKEEVLHIFAPPGKLGVVIDTPDDGAPVVHAVKDSSVIADRIVVGDKLVAVDDEDVRSMTADRKSVV